MEYTITKNNPKRGVWVLAANLYGIDRHTAKFIEVIIRERVKTDTAFIETEGGAFVSREITPYKG